MLAALGLSETGLWLLADRAGSALAQPARRKLALLVGINRYPQVLHPPNSATNAGISLTGCLTDVQLYRELLIHRFGFQPEDILTLTDEQATRSQIETTFIAHLRDRSQAGDLVVFHFSGYGSRIPLADDPNSWQNTLVPVDGGESDGEPGTVNDLLEETLWLMLRSLPTDRVLTLLDTSYVYPSRSLGGNFHIRARPASTVGDLTESARNFQKTVQQAANVLPSSAKRSQVPGIVLSAARPEEWAMETQWPGFSAGLFTYALTQTLWQTPPHTSLSATWQQAACQIKQWTGNSQHPQICPGRLPPCPEEAAEDENAMLPVWLEPIAVGADGAIVSIDPTERMARIWLAGLPAQVLESYGINSLLAVAPATPTDAPSPPLLQVRTREGALVKAQILASSELASLQMGQLVWEAVRALPRHSPLTVALDDTLERIERVDATSAFAALRYVSPVSVGEQPADFLFGRVKMTTPMTDSSLKSESAPELAILATTQEAGSRYGLFSRAGELVPGSLTNTEEAVKTAIARLSPQLERLRAVKLLDSIVNEGSSRLAIQATLKAIEPIERAIWHKQTLRGKGNGSGLLHGEPAKRKMAAHESKDGLKLPDLSNIGYEIANWGDRPIYFVLFSFDPDGQSSLYYPFAPDLELHHRPVSSGDIATIPPVSSSPAWQQERSSPSFVKTYILCSTRPFSATLAALEGSHVPKSNEIEKITNPLEMVTAAIEDLHQTSLPTTQELGLSKDLFALDTNQWATLSFVY